MGELDLCKDCGGYTGMSGEQYFMLTVVVTWLPLVIAGFVLQWRGGVQEAMRGAGLLRLVARFAIAVQMAAAVFAGLALAVVASEIWSTYTPSDIVAMAVTASVALPIIAISAGGIIAWHRVLVALASREGDGRMLV